MNKKEFEELKRLRRIYELKFEIYCWKVFIEENKNKIDDLSCWEKAIKENESKLIDMNKS